ncbi:hypothetical protein HDU82_006990 [Entophlyctis luteolus]|nr:hypothetical protein HDU82_006990 [Entophlyctis luteolus]
MVFPRFSPLLKEVRIHCSQTSSGSKGTRCVRVFGSWPASSLSTADPVTARDFVLNSYAALKQANPTLPILVREAQNVEARVFGRYAAGVERKIILENLDEAAVASRIKQLGETVPSASQH